MWVQTLWDPLHKKNQSPMHSKDSGIRVVAYCRVSNNRNNLNSFMNQISYFTNLIKSKPNWKFTGVYFDSGASGVNYRNRPGFKRMLRHCNEGRIDLILTKSISRFSRNTTDLIDIVTKLKKNNISVYFEKERIDTSLDYNSYLMNISAAFGQEEVEHNSEQTRWGHEKRFMKGIPMYGYLYGYDIDKNKGNPIVTINEYEANVIRWIFDKFINGSSYSEITKELTEKRVKTKKGNYHWSSAQVLKIIKDINYTGNKIARTKTRDVLSNSSKKGVRDEFYFENSHPAIISQEVFEQAQMRMKKIKRDFPKHIPHTTRPFSKRIMCGYCKQIYYGKENRWNCRTTKISKDLCPSKAISDKAIIKMITKAFKIRFNFEDSNVLKDLLSIIKKINQNDHFEFHRLKYLTEIEIAYKKGNTDEANELIKDYNDFESKVQKVEDDRIYRDKVVVWLKTIKDIDSFCKFLTVEYVRAWVTDIVVYTMDAFIVHWIDEQNTVVGDCENEKMIIPKINEVVEINNELGGDIKLTKRSDKKRVSKESNNYNETKQNEVVINQDEVKDVNSNVNVVKINPGENQVEKIKKILGKSNTAKVYQNLTNHKDQVTRVAAYCRVSTDEEQQLVSFKTQVAYYTYLILKNKDWELAGIYADQGLSGTSMKNRTEFNKMLDNCKKGKIDLIIIKSISRFSRNYTDTISTIRMLKALPHPVYCYFEKENINTCDEKAELMLGLYSSVSQEEVNNISKNISWSHRKLAQRGIIAHKLKIYGYDFDKDGNWIINENEAKVVKRIYQEYYEGKGNIKIIETLYKDGVKSPNGEDTWSSNTIYSIIKNEKYKGDYLYQKYYHIDVVNRKQRKNDGALPKYYIEQHHPAIIDPDFWDLVQEEVKKRSRKPVQYRDGYAGRESFYQKFYCENCHGIMSRTGKKGVKKEWNRNTWFCYDTAVKKNGMSCGSGFREQYIEYNFMNVLFDVINNPVFKVMVEGIITDLSLTKEEIILKEQIEKEVKDLNQQLYEVVDTELNQNGQDTKKVDWLTGEIVKRLDKLKDFEKREEKAKHYKNELHQLLNIELQPITFRDYHNMDVRIKPGESIYATSRCAKDSTYFKDNIDHFRDDIFKRFVLKGEINTEGKIKYTFVFGIGYESDMVYADYLDKFEKTKTEIHEEELFNSKEVKLLKKYCKIPRSSKEMRLILGINSYNSFSKRIFKPLLKAGKLQVLDPSINIPKYYWTEK